MPISATLCTHKNILGGWPAIFYFTTIVVIIWLLLWTFYVKSNPQQHRWMSAREKSYLKANTVTRSGQENINKAMLKIFLQPAVLIIIICQGAATWGMFTLLFYLPQYLRDVMMIDMKKNGLYSAAPFLSQLVFRVCFGVIADLLYKKCHMNRTTVVKLFNTIGFFGLGSLTFGSAFIGCRYSSLAVFTICMGTGLWAAVVAGFVTSMILIVPKYTSIISSCSKFFGTSVSVILPYVIGVVVRDGYQSEWRLIFGLSFGILFVCGLAFVIWGSGEEISIEEKEKAHSKKTNGDNQSYV
ncbi:hypothetical protein D918_02921 [Trichuris suis]|nr:hypothetical protein D918_02921 [Trichuris suis]